jgi:hypothetical protein
MSEKAISPEGDTANVDAALALTSAQALVLLLRLCKTGP